MKRPESFAPGWVTLGWSRINGVWSELGSVGGVYPGPPPVPELGVHDMADLLNNYREWSIVALLRRRRKVRN
jgi:hypothetical protein